MIRFISFEGGDGSGKSTQLRLIEQYLTARGTKCLSTREPGGTSLGKMIRQVVLQVGEREVAWPTELFLYLADRAQHVTELIQPALRSGMLVLCDRFMDSTVAYQGYGRGVDLAMLRRLNDIASRGIVPDLTFLLDCPVEVGLSRTRQRSQISSPAARSQDAELEGLDRFERERLDFHEKVRQGFLEIARAEKDRFVILDARQSVAQLHDEIKRIVEERLMA